MTQVTDTPLVAHVIHRLDYGGMETVLVNLINRMGDQPYRHAVICMAGYTDFRARIRSREVQVFSLNKREGKDLPSYWRLWRLLRRLAPDLVNTYNLSTLDAAPVARLAGCRVVHAEHGWTEGRDAVPQRYIRLRRWLRPFIDRFVAVSEDIHAWLSDTVGVASSRLVCIHNGVDANAFLRGDAARQSARTELGIDPQSFVVGTVARLDPVKAQTDLVAAAGRLAADAGKTRPVRVCIVGDGPERARLEALVRERGLEHVVHLAGARSDVSRWLAAFDVFALPSENEGVSIAILEAMASGLPVVASKVGGNPEVVLDGVTGTLVAAGDPAGLAEALARYRDAPALRQRHGEAGRGRLEAEFSLDAMVDRYRRLYDEVLGYRSAVDAHREVV